MPCNVYTLIRHSGLRSSIDYHHIHHIYMAVLMAFNSNVTLPFVGGVTAIRLGVAPVDR